MNIVHVYAQPFWHEEAYIVGNRDGLLALRDAVDAALATERGRAEVFVDDGEGYSLEILAVSDDNARHLAVPYTAELAREPPDGAGILWPRKLLQSIMRCEHGPWMIPRRGMADRRLACKPTLNVGEFVTLMRSGRIC